MIGAAQNRDIYAIALLYSSDDAEVRSLNPCVARL